MSFKSFSYCIKCSIFNIINFFRSINLNEISYMYTEFENLKTREILLKYKCGVKFICRNKMKIRHVNVI